MRKTVARLLTLAMAISACSVAATDSSTTSTTTTSSTTSTSTTSSTSSTSTTVDSRPTSLINGLPVDDPTLIDRRVLAVKIDNHPRANPQSGIDQADMVIEVLVEGITRYITLWHESDSDYLGPNRSGRPTDGSILAALNEPTFTISGAQAWVQNFIRGKGVNLIKELSPGTFRISGRSAPHNLYVDTFTLRETADSRGFADSPPEKPLWEFGEMPATAQPASQVSIDFSGNTVRWTWDESSGTWQRTAYGSEANVRDRDGNVSRIGVPVMVALYVEQYTVSPPSGQSGSSLPSSRTTGSGKAYVFANGSYVEGTWERAAETDWFTLTDADGNTMFVPPGKSWVSMVPASRGLTISD